MVRKGKPRTQAQVDDDEGSELQIRKNNTISEDIEAPNQPISRSAIPDRSMETRMEMSSFDSTHRPFFLHSADHPEPSAPLQLFTNNFGDFQTASASAAPLLYSLQRPHCSA